MQDSNVSELIRSTRSWNKALVQYELKMELREREHLLRKSKERALTAWEIGRLSEIGKGVIGRVKALITEQNQYSEAA